MPFAAVSSRAPQSARVVVGGTEVSVAQALAAVEVLEASRTSAIAPVLRAAGSPLASCDYKAAARPWAKWAATAPKTGRSGAAGRHVTKDAFRAAIAHEVAQAADRYVSVAVRAMTSDERYLAQAAADAVDLLRKDHAAQVRRQVEGAVEQAVARCQSTGSACALAAACGTGPCRFAPVWLQQISVPAVPGKTRRPSGHADAPAGFSPAPAIAQAIAAIRFRPQVLVRDTETVTAAECAA